jgi:hypothetical protein
MFNHALCVFSDFRPKCTTKPYKPTHVPSLSSCTQCPRVYMSKNSLRRHVRENHSSTPKKVKVPTKCPECTNLYTTKKGLKDHFAAWHNMPKIYFCSWCDKKYLNKIRGTQHITSQHGGDATLIPREAEVAHVPDKWSKPFEASTIKRCKVNIIHATEEMKNKKTKAYRGPQTKEGMLFLMDPTQKINSHNKHSSYTSANKTINPTGEGFSRDLDQMASQIEEGLTSPHVVPSLPDISKDFELSDDSEIEPEATTIPSIDPKIVLALLNTELALSDESSR